VLDAAGIGEHDEQHAGEADCEACRSQARDWLGERKPSHDRDEEWGRVGQDRGDGAAGTVGPYADADLR
jgi:hypothetical protein